eukprot:TRINITY_DN2650_c0_g2_i5.p3 TRINITY_DN2650_c0_g2~~TRINITY_DN2650_c0_g2_i5.p3  ORF type:complete len:141 (-),score=0.61 TRINITY_DN2650_c0_g2_i5:623-1045(-)
MNPSLRTPFFLPSCNVGLFILNQPSFNIQLTIILDFFNGFYLKQQNECFLLSFYDFDDFFCDQKFFVVMFQIFPQNLFSTYSAHKFFDWYSQFFHQFGQFNQIFLKKLKKRSKNILFEVVARFMNHKEIHMLQLFCIEEV